MLLRRLRAAFRLDRLARTPSHGHADGVARRLGARAAPRRQHAARAGADRRLRDCSPSASDSLSLSLAILMILFWRLGVPPLRSPLIAVLATVFIQVVVRRRAACSAPARRARSHSVVTPWRSCSPRLKLLADPYVIFLIIVASLFGLFVGAIPGLTAAMAIALLVPVTFFMPPLPALAMMVTVLRHGDLRGRHSGRALAHSRHARLGGLCGRSLCDDPQGRGTARARRGRRVLGDRRDSRHDRAGRPPRRRSPRSRSSSARSSISGWSASG